ncbi:MAG: hypothetical protein ACREJO_16900 [Phycisphaerales bacterium]
MSLLRTLAFSLVATAGFAATASADTVNAVITADNHYSLYAKTGSVVSLIGGNELGAGGAPGTYNWSLPENASFEAGDRIYIAAWSDGSVAQGLLAQITLGNTSLDSGHPLWQVYATGLDLGDGDPWPSAIQIDDLTKFADENNLWEAPFVGGANGIAPWGAIPGINESAKWMWYNAPNVADPLQGGSNAGEFLIFSMAVPTPGAAALAGLGGLVALRRRRR